MSAYNTPWSSTNHKLTVVVYAGRFEADFKENSYGLRLKRSQHIALEAVRKACNNEGNWVVDEDIKTYFDHINHKKLLILLEERISDRRELKLIRQWLETGVMVNDVFESLTSFFSDYK